jgi:hypothetical protein
MFEVRVGCQISEVGGGKRKWDVRSRMLEVGREDDEIER